MILLHVFQNYTPDKILILKYKKKSKQRTMPNKDNGFILLRVLAKDYDAKVNKATPFERNLSKVSYHYSILSILSLVLSARSFHEDFKILCNRCFLI